MPGISSAILGLGSLEQSLTIASWDVMPVDHSLLSIRVFRLDSDAIAFPACPSYQHGVSSIISHF